MEKHLEQDLIEDYVNKVPLKELKKKYKTSSDTIYKILDSNSIKRTNHKDLSKFKNLTKDTLYWLGYLCADGNIEYSPNKRVYKVSLFSKDECVVDDFILYFGDICKKYQRKQNGIFEVAIHSKELCEFFMEELNIIPNKGLQLDPNLPYTPSFIRGYFDGDGSIRGDGRAEAKFTSGSKIFIDKLSGIFINLGIYFVIREKGNAYDICFERKSEVLKLYKFLYSENGQKLKRKLDNFVAIYGNIDENNTVNCGNEIDNPQPSLLEITERFND